MDEVEVEEDVVDSEEGEVRKELNDWMVMLKV